jgi:hypothetical protein
MAASVKSRGGASRGVPCSASSRKRANSQAGSCGMRPRI